MKNLSDEVNEIVFESDPQKAAEAKLEAYAVRKKHYNECDLDELIDAVEFWYKHVTCNCAHKTLTYEWTMYYVAIPEMLRRLRLAREDRHSRSES